MALEPAMEVTAIGPTEPPQPLLEEATIEPGTVIGIRLDSPVSSEHAKLEDRVRAVVTRDVTLDDQVVLPAGSVLEGTVTLVQRGGRFREQAKIGVQFSTLALSGNLRVPIETEAIYRTGEAPSGGATSKIGAATVVGTILGAVVGGKKGAAIGSTAGAAGGTAVVMQGDASEAVIPAGAPLTVRLTARATIPVEPRR
jgi:hypothetical protein